MCGEGGKEAWECAVQERRDVVLGVPRCIVVCPVMEGKATPLRSTRRDSASPLDRL